MCKIYGDRDILRTSFTLDKAVINEWDCKFYVVENSFHYVYRRETYVSLTTLILVGFSGNWFRIHGRTQPLRHAGLRNCRFDFFKCSLHCRYFFRSWMCFRVSHFCLKILINSLTGTKCPHRLYHSPTYFHLIITHASHPGPVVFRPDEIPSSPYTDNSIVTWNMFRKINWLDAKLCYCNDHKPI